MSKVVVNGLDEVVARPVADGERRRHERATRMVEAMTEREARMVREAQARHCVRQSDYAMYAARVPLVGRGAQG